MRLIHLFIIFILSFCMSSCAQGQRGGHDRQPKHDEGDYFVDHAGDTVYYVIKSEEQWKQELSKAEYNILREKGTETAFTGKYWDNKEKGVYTCAGCGLPIFSSDTKFKSGTGWPSFTSPLDETHIAETDDRSLGMTRTEVLCARCNGHLGHVFNDGPPPTGLRYCLNSAALNFSEK